MISTLTAVFLAPSTTITNNKVVLSLLASPSRPLSPASYQGVRPSANVIHNKDVGGDLDLGGVDENETYDDANILLLSNDQIQQLQQKTPLCLSYSYTRLVILVGNSNFRITIPWTPNLNRNSGILEFSIGKCWNSPTV
jgi:hypothetical protein